MAHSVFLILYLLAIVELLRKPSFLFAYAIGLISLPVYGIALDRDGHLMLPINETAIFIALLFSIFQFLLFAWLVCNMDRYLRDHSQNKIVGKWTTISGICGLILLYFGFFLSSYWDAAPVSLLIKSPYTGTISELRKIAYPLLLVGATWHPSRMVFYWIDSIDFISTKTAVKYLPYLVVLLFIYDITMRFLLGFEFVNLSVVVDIMVLFLPAIVSVGSSIREYERYGLEYRSPVGKNRVSSSIYRFFLRSTLVFPIAGFCFGLWSSLFNWKNGVWASMDPLKFLFGIIFIPIFFWVIAWFIPGSIFQEFPENVMEHVQSGKE